ncbi:zf-CHY-domain-containing protein [Acrodontium crateriforme]|uniref:Zf-CHY-domain-containing protein n=1 Tax=Acrodontium crateriforme TaxID=150365 RepID=A0AAQ3M4X8_9PEZI|nr:zf-CHY-domain-containing protein [Acrodontium crateriforme]
MEGPLPDDDGMRSLRQKLLEIRLLAISTEEKAMRMHNLMTQDYMAHKAGASSPTASPEAPPRDCELPPEPSKLAPPIDPANPYNLRPGDLEPSFSPLAVTPLDTNRHVHQESDDEENDEDEDDDFDNAPILGCRHYKRNVKVQCFDCHGWFPCRHCHDQARDLPFDHTLNRKRTQNMLCMLCHTPQPAAEICTNCGEYAAWYYCDKCKLWDNDSNKRIYHCDDCGICRVGEGLGKDYVHCKRCNVCISIATSAAHPCIERATEGDCPLCLMQLFESQAKVVSLPCGHYMHGDCYKDLMAVTYKCPVCSKSAVNMELQWRKLDEEIQFQPMPDDNETLISLLPRSELNNAQTTANEQPESEPAPSRRPKQVYIGCNDCGSRCWTPFHWLGVKCQVCDSYNTVQMAPTAFQETEAERLVRQQLQHQHHRQHDLTGNAVLRDAGIDAGVRSPVDSALDVPSSPSNLPVLERRPSGAHSPGRYFVRDDEIRRPNLAAAGSRFSTPNLPSMPNLPNMPNFPQLPDMPRMPRMPNLPNLPNMPNLPTMPNFPDMSNIELSRFSPYGMMNAVSRSLSPMRYYLQGLDVRDHGFMRRPSTDRNRSPTSIRSDPTADATSTKMALTDERDAASYVDDEGTEFWGEDERGLSGNKLDGRRAGDEEDDEDDSSDDSDVSDADMLDDADDEEEDMALFGHR